MVVRSERTAQGYEILVKRARDAVAPGSSGLSFLGDTAAVMGWIEGQEWSVNTKKAAYIAIKSTLRDAADATLKDAEKEYEKRMLHYRDLHNEQAAKQELSAREAELFVEWPVILKATEKVRVSVSDFFEYQDWVVFCLYTMVPPVRLDYGEMRVVGSRGEVDTSGNYLITEASGWKFLLQEYKTAVKYGALLLDIPGPLEEVLREWLELNPSGWLLCDTRGQPMMEKGLANAIKRVMQRAVGKDLGVNMLRHSYVSWNRRGEPTFLEQREMAKRMCHSPGMSVLYRRLR